MTYNMFSWFRKLARGIRMSFAGCAPDCTGGVPQFDPPQFSAAEGTAAVLWLRDSPYKYKRVVYRKEDHIRENDEIEEDAERAVRQRVVNELD